MAVNFSLLVGGGTGSKGKWKVGKRQGFEWKWEAWLPT